MQFDKDLQHVFNELDLTCEDQKKLWEAEIRTFDSLYQSKRWKEEEVGLHRRAKKYLARTIEWYDNFCNKTGRKPNLLCEFNEDLLDQFVPSAPQTKASAVPEKVKELVLSMMADKQAYSKCADFDHAVFNRDATDYLLEQCGMDPSELESTALTMRSIPSIVQNMCTFDPKEIIEGVHDCLDTKSKTELLFYGPPQSGKTALKCVIMYAAHYKNCPVVILTHGKMERNELVAKLSSYTKGSKLDGTVLVTPTKNKIDETVQRVQDGGTIVSFNTEAQMRNVSNTVKGLNTNRFILVVDECDAMLRTEEKTQNFEKAFQALQDLSPILTYKISATMLPVMFNEQVCDEDKFATVVALTPDADYVGIDQMKRFEVNGIPVDIDRSDLSPLFCFQENGLKFKIPFANINVLGMYHDAASRPFSLLLDVTTPFVKRDIKGNVFQKAERVQDYLYYAKKKRVHVIVIVGIGIFVKHAKDCTEGNMPHDNREGVREIECVSCVVEVEDHSLLIHDISPF